MKIPSALRAAAVGVVAAWTVASAGTLLAQGPPVCQEGDVLHYSVATQDFTNCGPAVRTFDDFLPQCATGQILLSGGQGTWSCADASSLIGGVACDYDQDGTYDATDVTQCRRVLAGLPVG